MKKIRAKFTAAAAIFLAVAMVVGVSAIAASNYGTSSDPLVTLSYLTGKLTPGIMTELQEYIDTAKNDLTSKFNSQISSVDSGGQSAADFTLVTLSEGQVLKCSVGTELLLRIGTAAGYGANEPVLVNETSGATLAAGKSVVKNNMYMVTIANNGIKATAATVKVLVSGTYTIS